MSTAHASGPADPAGASRLLLELDLPIRPLLVRHVGDAAFMAMQRLDLVHSKQAGLQELMRFDRVLQAHLDGLLVAGGVAMDEAWTALHRWGGPGEVFVCAALALVHEDGVRLESLWKHIEELPAKRLVGLELALAWTAQDPERPPLRWIQHWVEASHVPALQACALRAAAACPVPLPDAWEQALGSESAEVRATACRVAASVPSAVQEARLLPLLADPAREVSVEAAVCLLSLSADPDRRSAALMALERGLAPDLPSLRSAPGANGVLARRDTLRRLRVLALHQARGHDAARVCDSLPAHAAAEYVAWHGDTALLPGLIARADHPEFARAASWGVLALCGVEVESLGLAGPGLDPRGRSELMGLPSLDPEAGSHWWRQAATHFVGGQRWLFGQPLAETARSALIERLHSGPQALRWLAARHLGGLPEFRVDVRASHQASWLLQMDAALP